MAYVLWRVFMKKYSKVRLGIRNLPVIPADRRIPEKEEIWTLATEDNDPCNIFETVKDSKVKGSQEVGKACSKSSDSVTVEDPGETVDSNLPRSQETRKSKTKKVKSYLKKCKGALSKADKVSTEKKRQENCTSWYLEDAQASTNRLDENDVERYRELSDDRIERDDDTRYRASREISDPTNDPSKDQIPVATSCEVLARLSTDNCTIDLDGSSRSSFYEDAHESSLPTLEEKPSAKESENLQEPTTNEAVSLETLTAEDTNLNKCDSSDTLIAEVPPEVTECAVDLEVVSARANREEEEARTHDDETTTDEEPARLPTLLCGGRGDVATLVRNLLGPIYGEGVIGLLIRQARDILVCAYHGNLENFVRSYLKPAASLLAKVKSVATETGNESVVPQGWPLTLGLRGLVLQLGELEASALRYGECYLCVRSAAATASTSGSGVGAATETVERNTVEIAVVWRATSMRAPGILGWDREDEFMDWRESSHKAQSNSSGAGTNLVCPLQSSSATKVSRPRRRSREETLSRTREGSRNCEDHRRREETRSIDRLDHRESQEYRVSDSTATLDPLTRVNPAIGQSASSNAVMKSKSASSVDAWKQDLEDELVRMAASATRVPPSSKNSSSLLGDEIRAKVKRCAKVVSSTTMEKWKEAARCETRSRTLLPEDLKTPLRLDEAVSSFCQDDGASASKDLEDRLRGVRSLDDVTDDELPTLIGNLLVTVERKIERVSLDDLTFPCPACRNIDTDDPLLGCRCAGDDYSCEGGEDSCDCPSSSISRAEQSARTFEVAGIKHIDSDDEEEVRMGFGTKKRIDEIICPRTIHDVPEHVLTGGFTLPGYCDTSGRPVLEFEESASRTEVPSAKEISSLALYLARLSSSDRAKGYTLLVRTESPECMELVDNVLVLLQGRVEVRQTLLLRSTTATEETNDSLLPLSRVKVIVVTDETIVKYVPRREGSFDRSQWIAFYKEYDGLMTEWQAAGRRLALEMSELKECTSLSGTLTPLGRFLTDPTLRRTSRDAEEAIAAIEERAAPLLHIEDIRLAVKRARILVEEVGNAATRLESSFESRRATIRNLAVLRSIEDQAHEVLSWLCKKGEDVLSKHAQHAATNLTAARLHEREFEKFYFTSMVSTKDQVH